MRSLTRPLALILTLALAACGGGQPSTEAAPPSVADATPAPAPTPAAPDEEPLPGDPEAGKAVYDANCFACHMADGTGMGGALGADFVNDASRRARTNEQLLTSISKGVEGTAMVAWEPLLTEQQRKDVLAYIRVTYMGHGGP